MKNNPIPAPVFNSSSQIGTGKPILPDPSLCPNPEQCGSCGWSHIPYPKQLEQKLGDINGSFKIKQLGFRVERIIPSPLQDHYRNRMDFVIDFQGKVGLREKGKWWRVIDNHPCFLADEKIDGLFYKVRNWVTSAGLSFYDRKASSGLLRYAVIRSSTIGETMLIVVTSAPSDDTESKMIVTALEQLKTIPALTTLIWSINHTISDVSYGDEERIIFGPGYIAEELLGKLYRISPNAFFQTNPHCAPELIKVVREFMGDCSDKTVLDLYCGTGLFSIALASDCKQMIGVEINETAIKDANINAELNNLTNKITYHASPTEQFDWLGIGADTVILDPPRSGLHPNTLAEIIGPKGPNKLIYVSCNYKNLARELVELKTKYKVAELVAIDMFPHTPHVEVIVKLERIK